VNSNGEVVIKEMRGTAKPGAELEKPNETNERTF